MVDTVLIDFTTSWVWGPEESRSCGFMCSAWFWWVILNSASTEFVCHVVLTCFDLFFMWINHCKWNWRNKSNPAYSGVSQLIHVMPQEVMLKPVDSCLQVAFHRLLQEGNRWSLIADSYGQKHGDLKLETHGSKWSKWSYDFIFMIQTNKDGIPRLNCSLNLFESDGMAIQINSSKSNAKFSRPRKSVSTGLCLNAWWRSASRNIPWPNSRGAQVKLIAELLSYTHLLMKLLGQTSQTWSLPKHCRGTECCHRLRTSRHSEVV